MNREIWNFAQSKRIESNTKEYFTVDSIRHAFISFKSGGIYLLYKNREAESWYPKVVIRKKLRLHNLTGDVEIYRGTSKTEFKSGQFSQSWTLKEEVANDFAFKHYDSHEAYIGTERVVLKSLINAHHIYYYDETDNEQEVIVDERRITDLPTIVSENVL